MGILLWQPKPTNTFGHNCTVPRWIRDLTGDEELDLGTREQACVASASQPEVLKQGRFPRRGHLAMSGDISDCQNLEGVLQALSEKRPAMPLNTLQITGLRPA